MLRNYQKADFPLYLVKVLDRIAISLRIFKRSFPLNSTESISPLLIVGCGRSGNTLLRSMLVTGREIAIPPESYVWPRVIRRFASFNFFTWDILSSMVLAEFEAYKEFHTWNLSLSKLHRIVRSLPKEKQSLANVIDAIYKYYAQENGMKITRWGDKTPINSIYIDKILQVFPHAKVIHIVRDPRDVVASYVKAGLYNDPIDAALFWKAAIKKINQVKQKLEKNNQITEVQYEDLVTGPEETLKKLCEFSALAYKPEMLDFHKNFEKLGDTIAHEHHKNVQSPLSTTSIGKGKNYLSKHVVNQINVLLQKEMSMYKYH